jgi:hypothetical protein
MAHGNEPPKTVAELIDHLDRLREELLTIQRSLEKMEPVEILVLDCVKPAAMICAKHSVWVTFS